MIADDFRRAVLQADPRLSRFNPLSRILAYDDFDNGMNGWCELCGNHDNNLDSIRPSMRDLRPPQLSTCTFFDIGTHGAVDGTYALKLATRAQPNHAAVGIKRLTMAALGLVQLELYLTYKAEATFEPVTAGGLTWDGNVHPSEATFEPVTAGGLTWDGNVHPSEAHFGDFTLSCDVCHPDGRRHHCALRYINADAEARLVQTWHYKTSLQPTTRMMLSGESASPEDWQTASPDDWSPVPGGYQPLCFNEVPTKINWHYLRWRFDTGRRRHVELQVNERTFDLREIPVPVYPHRYASLSGLLNLFLDVRTRLPVRNFLYVDSAVISVDW